VSEPNGLPLWSDLQHLKTGCVCTRNMLTGEVLDYDCGRWGENLAPTLSTAHAIMAAYESREIDRSTTVAGSVHGAGRNRP
jgi:hypothetical protein